MKYLLIAVIISINLTVDSVAQPTSNAFNTVELRSIVGSDQEKLRVLFVGDDVRKHLDGSVKRLKYWERLKKKTDAFIVFSEQTKVLLEKAGGKHVYLAENHAQFFKRTWRDYDFLTWIDLNGNDVAFVETSGREEPQTNEKKAKRKQHQSDTELAEYVSGLTDNSREVEVLVVGRKVTVAMLDTLDLKDEFAKLDTILTHIIVYSEQVGKALDPKTDVQIIVTDEGYKEGSSIGSLKWMIIEVDGSKLIRVRGSGKLERIITPRSRHDKPQE